MSVASSSVSPSLITVGTSVNPASLAAFTLLWPDNICPKFIYDKNIKINYKSKNPTTLGIAFDYLMRTYIKYQNPSLGIDNKSLVEERLHQIPAHYKTDTMVSIELIKETEKNYEKSQVIDDSLIILYLQLAHFDVAFRTGTFEYFPDDISKVNTEDIIIIIIKQMLRLLNKSEWNKFKSCHLNPNFNESSLIVGGADADLICDDILIDIKSNTVAGMSRTTFDQLIIYYSLHRIDCMINSKTPTIKRLGVYKARYGELIEFNIHDIASEESIFDFIYSLIGISTTKYGYNSDNIKSVLKQIRELQF